MEDPECPRRRRPARWLGWMLGASVMVCLGEPAANRPGIQVSYPASATGKAANSVAVPLAGTSLFVAVVRPGADATRPTAQLANREVPMRVIGYDPVSSLTLLQIDGVPRPKEIQWRRDTTGVVGIPLIAMTPSGALKCKATGWTQQVGAKILPFALLQVSFEQGVPSSGTPLIDPQGRVAALIFQGSPNGQIGYAIPAEAIHRVKHDLMNGGTLVRAWLGLSLRSEIKAPKIVQVLPDSPAARSGIQPADVLVKIGPYDVSDYTDAVNAFFYLIPGKAVRVKLQRGQRTLEYDLTPTRPPGR